MRPDYKREFEKERQRLAQLWDAYELQGAEMNKLQRHVERLELTVHEKDQKIAALKEAKAVGKMGKWGGEKELTRTRDALKDAELEIKLLTDNLREQQETTKGLREMAQDLSLQVEEVRKEVMERDRLINQLKTMLESKDEELARLRTP
ncbi:MAG: hypothetical protein JSW25_09810 [Thermoplasmata archaeon]|nr:MAG: hypothetical protein JSW25_09810 [Thermoplasmata archaeon]